MYGGVRTDFFLPLNRCARVLFKSVLFSPLLICCCKALVPRRTDVMFKRTICSTVKFPFNCWDHVLCVPFMLWHVCFMEERTSAWLLAEWSSWGQKVWSSTQLQKSGILQYWNDLIRNNEYCCSRWVYLKDVRCKKYKMFHQAILLEVRYLGLRLLNKLIGLFDVHLASQQLAFVWPTDSLYTPRRNVP